MLTTKKLLKILDEAILFEQKRNIKIYPAIHPKYQKGYIDGLKSIRRHIIDHA